MHATPSLLSAIFAVLPSLAIAAEPIIVPAQLKSLVEEFDVDEFHNRDQGTKELRKMGLPALEALQKARFASRSAEVRDRTERLSREILYASFPRGNPVDGVQLTLRSQHLTFPRGKPIAMELEVANVNRPKIAFPTNLRWSYYQSYGPAKYPQRSCTTPSHGNIFVHQLSGVKGEKSLGPIACGPVSRSPFQELKTGESLKIAVDVTMLGQLLPGDYEARVSLHIHELIKDSAGSLESNVVRFAVE